MKVPAAHAPAVQVQHADEWVQTVLARPLFNRDRRPADAPAAVAAGEASTPLPRLTGARISPAGRRAIFAGADGGRPVVVGEGDSVAGYTVQAISPGAVTLQGPDGQRSVSPTFDPSPRRADADPNAPNGATSGQSPIFVPGQFPGQAPGQPPGVVPDPAQLLRPGYNRQRGDNGVLRQPGFLPQALAGVPRTGTE